MASVLDGKTDMAIGDVVGSNIFKVSFILGLSALTMLLAVHRQLIGQEVPIMFGVTLLMDLLLRDSNLQPWEGGWWLVLVRQSRRESAAGKSPTAEVDQLQIELQASLPGARC